MTQSKETGLTQNRQVKCVSLRPHAALFHVLQPDTVLELYTMYDTKCPNDNKSSVSNACQIALLCPNITLL
jgi:hypothetical protein